MPSLDNRRPIRSMTGFARVHRQTSAGELTVSLRSVNHRGLDLHFPHIGELSAFENAMRPSLKQQISRGHIEVRISLEKDVNTAAGLYNRELVQRYAAAFRQASLELQLDARLDLNMLFTMPGILDASPRAVPLDESLEAEVVAALNACIESLNAYREREGDALCAGLQGEISAIEDGTRAMLAIREQALPQFCQKLRERLQELLGDSTIPENRIIEEAALLSDKSDVQEELTRLTIHTQELRRILDEGGEVGKRLDFLLQEMNRETNTILSKSSGDGEAGLQITNLGLAIKANIERIREQALNLE
jgi:uncharacterized protein (TIGR00255 family)